MPDSFQAANWSCPVITRGYGFLYGSVKSISVPGRIKGKSTNISKSAGYHGYYLQIGATRIRDALSSLTFLTHLPIRQKGGKAYPFQLLHGNCRTSVLTTSRSGLQLTNCFSWAVGIEMGCKQIYIAIAKSSQYLMENWLV